MTGTADGLNGAAGAGSGTAAALGSAAAPGRAPADQNRDPAGQGGPAGREGGPAGQESGPPGRERGAVPKRGFAGDAQLHRRDAPRHCPRCGASLLAGAGISVEFWQGADRIFHTWCASCRWTGDIIPVTDMIGHEPDH